MAASSKVFLGFASISGMRKVKKMMADFQLQSEIKFET
jgi:hypothetical protein